MREAMEHHHYFVQYHLYTLALHRFLRWRLGREYDYDKHIGGAYYLFIRGMVGPDTPRYGERVHGVFFDRPARAVIEALDRLFDDPRRARRGAPPQTPPLLPFRGDWS